MINKMEDKRVYAGNKVFRCMLAAKSNRNTHAIMIDKVTGGFNLSYWHATVVDCA